MAEVLDVVIVLAVDKPSIQYLSDSAMKEIWNVKYLPVDLIGIKCTVLLG